MADLDNEGWLREEMAGLRARVQELLEANTREVLRRRAAEGSLREMLSAAKRVVEIADRRTVEFDAARAAIAKAEGLLDEPDVAKLVDRFLAWPLPASVCADRCATRTDYPHPRYGTSLLSADEARQMIEYLLGGASR